MAARSRPILKRHLHAHPKTTDETWHGGVGAWGGHNLFASSNSRHIRALVPDILELQFDSIIEIPVQAGAETVHDAAFDALQAGAVVEIDVGIACGQFPGAPAPVEVVAVFIPGEPGVGERALAAEVIAGQGADFLVIAAALAGQDVGKLDVAAAEHIVLGGALERDQAAGSGEARAAGANNAPDIVNK